MATGSISLYRSLTIQFRVVGALLMRETLTRYGRHNIGVLWLIGEPLLFILGVSIMMYVARLGALFPVPLIAFIISGYSSACLWRNAAARCIRALEPNQALMYHRNVQILDIFISRVLLELIGVTASLTALTVFFVSIGAMSWPQDMILVFGGWALLCWTGFALACIVGVFSERSRFFVSIWQMVSFLLFHASGALFMVDWLPRGIQDAILWVPMVHGVEMVRHGYFGTIVPTHENPMYLVAANLFLTLIGLALVRASGRRIQSR